MTLRRRLAAEKILLAPGIFDALSAHIATRAGAEALYLSGASIAYTRFGRPDIGLVGMSEVADTIALIRDRTEVPMIVDGDTGFGNALNVQRTVRTFERMGASAIQLEDQTLPKRCGHLDGKTLAPKAEMVGKIHAALDARGSEEFLIVARTDAIAVEGFLPALERAAAYVDAGADVLFVEAMRDVDQMREVVRSFGDKVPLLANMVEGGKTPVTGAADLEVLGFSLVIFPGGAVRALAHAAEAYFGSLLSHGSNAPFAARMHDFASLNDVIGTEEMIGLGKRYGG